VTRNFPTSLKASPPQVHPKRIDLIRSTYLVGERLTFRRGSDRLDPSPYRFSIKNLDGNDCVHNGCIPAYRSDCNSSGMTVTRSHLTYDSTKLQTSDSDRQG